MTTQPLDLTNYIGHSFGFAKEPTGFTMTVEVPPDQQWRVEILQTLVERGAIPAETARAVVARGDWKAMWRLIRTATTTKQLPEQK